MSRSSLSNNNHMTQFSIFNSKNLFIISSLLLIFLLLQPITVTYVAGATSSWSDVEFEVTDVVWGNSDYLQDPNPGDNSVPLTITIMISNLRSPNYSITGVIGTLTVNSDEFTNSTGGTVQTQAVAGSYKLGKEITFNFILNIDEALVIGTYTPTLTVKSVIDTTSTVLLTDDMILNIPLEVLGRPDLTFKSTFNNNEAELTITNIGPGTANSVDLSFDGGVIISEDSNWNITKLDKNESKSFKFNLSADSSKNGDLVEGKIIASYRTDSGIKHKVQKSIPFHINSNTECLTFDNPNQYCIISSINSFTPYSELLTIENIQFPNGELKAGQINHLSFRLHNDSPYSLEKLTFSADQTENSKFTILDFNKLNLESVKPGDTISVKIRFYIPLELKDTAHNLVFNVEYIDINDSEIFTSESLTISLPVIKAVETFNLIDLELSSIPGKQSNSIASSVTGGKINQINVLVKNLADDDTACTYNDCSLSNIEISLDQLGESKSIGSDGTWSYSKLDAGETKIITLNLYVPETERESLDLKFTIKYTDVLGNPNTENRNLGLIVSSVVQSPIRIETTGSLYAPSDSSYVLRITNIGESAINDLEIELSTSSSVLSLVSIDSNMVNVGDNLMKIGLLEPNGSIDIELKINVPEDSVDIKSNLRLDVNYDYLGIYRTEARNIDLTVRGIIDLSLVELTVKPEPTMSGSKIIITGSILNSGSITAKAVTVNVLNPSVLSIMSSTTFIGDVDEGSQAPFSLTANLNDNLSDGVYELDVEIGYKDDRGIWQILTEKVNVHVSNDASLYSDMTDTESSSNPMSMLSIDPTVLVIIIILIILLLIIIRRRRRNKREQ